MTISKMMVRVSVGLMMGILVLAILPLLLVFSWVEMLGFSELYTSPLFLIQKLYKNEDQPLNKGNEKDAE